MDLEKGPPETATLEPEVLENAGADGEYAALRRRRAGRPGSRWTGRVGAGVALAVSLAVCTQRSAAGSPMSRVLAPVQAPRDIDPAVPTALEWRPAPPPRTDGPTRVHDPFADRRQVDEMAKALATLRAETPLSAEEAEEAAEAVEEAILARGPPSGVGLTITGAVLVGPGGLGFVSLGLIVRGLSGLCIDNCEERSGPTFTGAGFFTLAGASIAAGIVLLAFGVDRNARWRKWKARMFTPAVQRSAAGTWTLGGGLRF